MIGEVAKHFYSFICFANDYTRSCGHYILNRKILLHFLHLGDSLTTTTRFGNFNWNSFDPVFIKIGSWLSLWVLAGRARLFVNFWVNLVTVTHSEPKWVLNPGREGQFWGMPNSKNDSTPSPIWAMVVRLPAIIFTLIVIPRGHRPAKSQQQSLNTKRTNWVVHKLRAVLHRIRYEVQHLVFPHWVLLSSNGIFDVASPWTAGGELHPPHFFSVVIWIN